MPIRLIPSFLFYCYINGITPGPANLCSLSAALNYGRERALKQWRGLFLGFAVVALLSVFTNYFLGNVLGMYVKWLAYVGAAYLIWMAVHMVRGTGLRSSARESAEREDSEKESAERESSVRESAERDVKKVSEKDIEKDLEKAAERNCNFFTGLLVQLTNVKIILFCMTALSSYVLPYSKGFFSLLLVGLFLPFTGPICNLAWLFAGVKLQTLFQKHKTVLNWVMAAALVLCAGSLVWG